MNYPALIIVVTIYLAITIYLGWLGYRHTVSAKDYYTAGGDVHPFLMGMGYGAALVSTAAIVGFGGASAVNGYSMLWLAMLHIVVGVFGAFMWVGRRTRAMGRILNVQTFPELMGERYKSPFIRKFSAVVITIFMPLYAAAVMIGGARFMESALNANYTVVLLIFAFVVGAYVLAGGMKGVLYTSAFQGSLALLVMVGILIFTYCKLGGITASHTALASMTHLVPQDLVAEGHRGWTSMPSFLSSNWWYVMTTLVIGMGIGVLAQPQLAVRFMTVKSNKELYRGLPWGGLFLISVTGVSLTIGPLTNVYFYKTIGKISLFASINPVTKLPNLDSIIPLYISTAMPDWVTYVVMLTLISAAMSTLSGQFHIIATSISYDLYKPKDDKSGLKVARYGLVCGLFITIILSFILPGNIIAIATAIFFGLCAAGFFPLLMFGLYWKKVTTAGATYGMIVGTVVYVFVMLFINTKMSDIFRISELLFKKNTFASFPYSIIDPLVYALPVSIAVTVIVSLVNQSAISEEHVKKCFSFMRPKKRLLWAKNSKL
jgi:SSS family solute:Na+ symporter